MKKIFLTIPLIAATVFGCVKPELDMPVAEEPNYNTTLTAEVPVTKVAIDNEYRKLSWSNGDKISVLTSSGAYKEFTYTGEDGAKSAQFKGNLEEGETLAGYAIYPAHANHAVSNVRPKVYLPAAYDWEEGEIMGSMVATISEGKATFSHVGGLFAFDVQNLPAGAKGFKFVTSAIDMTGGFTLQNDNTLKAVESTNPTYVTFSFDALQEPTDMKFFIPAPTGSYPGFSIYYINSSNSPVLIKEAKSTNVIDAATVKVFSVSVEGGSWYVTATGSASADGLSWAKATTLSKALSKAKDGDVIHVGAGTYVPDTYIKGYAVSDGTAATAISTATSADHKAFIIDKGITLIGGYPAEGGNMSAPETNPTILSGNNVSDHVVIVAAPKASGTVKMSGFTVTGAKSENNGNNGWKLNGNVLYDYNGTVAILNTDVVLENVTVSGNSTANASAVYGAYSVVNMKNCTITENTASDNGTIWFAAGTDLTFTDSEISGNSATNAAGLYLYLSDGAEMKANVRGVTIKNNEASTKAGGVWLRGATAGIKINAVLDGCTISGNKAPTGAGMALENITGTFIKNTVITGNAGSGTKEGGAFYSLDASADYQNCTFSSNTASANGGLLVQSDDIATLNRFDRCTWKGNTTTGFANFYVYGKASDNNVIITNSLFNGNKVTSGRGGALYIRPTGAGKTYCKCVNTTFYGNQATSRGTAILVYSNNASYISHADLISCTICNNTNSGKYAAVMAETNAAGTKTATISLVNTIVEGNKSTNDNNIYDTGAYSGASITSEYCQTDGSNSFNTDGSNSFNYATMLGALNANGVCPLLLPESNPAVTGGMPLGELLALADENVPASVLATDQLGNPRSGNVIGAWAGVSAPTELTLSKTSIEAAANGGTYTVNVSGSTAWTVSTTDSWIGTVTKSNTGFSFTLPKNTGMDSRQGVIYVTLNNRYYSVNVSQASDPSIYAKGASSKLGQQIAFNTPFISQVTSDSYTQVNYGVGLLKMQFKGQDAGTNHPMAICLYEVDLTSKATIAVTCTNDSDASISETGSTTQTVRRQLAAMQSNRTSETILGGINGDFFVKADNYKAQGICYRKGVCLKDSFYEDNNTVFAIKKDGSAMIMNQTQYNNQKTNILEAIGGRQRLVAYGEPYVTNNDVYTPRTAVGVSKDGTKVYMLVIDGRNDSWSYGATFHDAAKLLIAAGAYNAINLDGGGSSTIVQRNREDGTTYTDYKILNKPMDDNGSSTEREVVNGLAIIIK